MKNPFENRLEQDLKLRDLMIASVVKTEEFKPTEISLQDTVSCVERKYGKDWMDFPEAKCIVIWAAKTFLDEHVKKIVPDLYDLCMEYKTNGTINDRELPSDFYLLPFSLFDKEYVYEGPFGSSPVSDAYFKLTTTVPTLKEEL